jgi:hypothetical protein
MIQILLSVIFVASTAFASPAMFPENLPNTSAQVELGRGFLPKTLEVSVGACAAGSWIVTEETTRVEPFATPVLYKMKTGIRAIFTAVSSHRQNRELKPYKFRNEPVCGSQYVSSVKVGAKLSLIFNYWTTAEQVDQLEAFLKSNLTDVRKIFDVNPVSAGIKMNGFGVLYSGSGATDKLAYYNNTCKLMNKNCDYYLEEAFAVAESLDSAKAPASEDVITFTVDDYPNTK